MEDLTGKSLGQYQITGPLGEGGMAAVYKAYQTNMDRYVALKILPRHLAQDPQFVKRFHQEARIIAKLQHPHILPVFDFGEQDGYTYLVMPFVESGTLGDLQTGQPMPPDEVREIITQIGDALDYAHSQGVVHRDVKPSNILVDERGNCLLTDFGIGKILAGSQQLTRSGEMVGTPAYASPEQGLGDEIDGRTDIYSLGVILFELATGRPPFKAETPMAILIKHIYDPLPPPRTINPALTEAMERVILKALAKFPKDRFSTAGEMVSALQAATEPAPVHQKAPETPAPRQEQSYAQKTAIHSKPAIVKSAPAVQASASPQRNMQPVWMMLGGGSLALTAIIILIAIVALGMWFLSDRSSQVGSPVNEANNSDPTQPIPTIFPERSAYIFDSAGMSLISSAIIWTQDTDLLDFFQAEPLTGPKGVYEQVMRLYVQGYGHGDQTAWFTVNVDVPVDADIISIPVATALNGSVDKTDSESGLEIVVRNTAGQESWTYASYLLETQLGFPYVYAFADVSPFQGQRVELTVTLRQLDACAGALCPQDADFFFGDLYFGRLPDICVTQFDGTKILYEYYNDPTPHQVSECDDPQPYYFLDIREGPYNAYGKGQSTFDIPFALPERPKLIEFRLYYGNYVEAFIINNQTFSPEEIYAAFPVRSATYLNIPEPSRYLLFNNNPGFVESYFEWGTNHIHITTYSEETWEERPFDLFIRFRIPTD